MADRKKNNLFRRWLTGEVYCDHKQGKDSSMMDKWSNTKPTTFTRYHILAFLGWLWGFIIGFPIMLGSLAAAAVTTLTTLLCVFVFAIFFYIWLHVWYVGKEHWYFQEIFDSVDFTHHESTYTHEDDRRFFIVHDKMAVARHFKDIDKVTELRHNIKMIYKNGKLSESTREFILENYPYLC